MRDKYVLECPYCGGKEVIEGYQSYQANVNSDINIWGATPLYHSICINCGSVLRSYVKEPEKLLKKKDRR